MRNLVGQLEIIIQKQRSAKQKQVDGAKVLNICTLEPEFVITFKFGYLMGKRYIVHMFTHLVKLDPVNCYNL